MLIPLAESSVDHESSRLRQEKEAVGRGIESEQVYRATTIADPWSLEVGDEVVRASYHGPAHTSGDAVIHLERAGAVHMGDLVFNRYPCFIDRVSGASIAGWIQLLEKTHERFSDSTVFVFGHGSPAYGIRGDRADLLAMRDFPMGLLEFADKRIAEGRAEDQVAETTRLPDFPNHYSESWANGVSHALRKARQELSAD